LSKNKNLDKFTEQDVIEANKRIYAKTSDLYEDIVFTKDSNKRLNMLIEHAIKILKTKKNNITALDACGGTGQAALLLNDLQCQTDLVDLSSSMVENMKKKCKKNKLKINFVVSEINQFLNQNNKKFDLIVFSSALHHLRYPDEVLKSAVKNLSDGGIIATISDPTKNIQRRLFKSLSFLDRMINHLLSSPINFIKILLDKLFNRKNDKEKGNKHPDWIAEYHTVNGIDDEHIIVNLIENGNHVLLHKRFTGGYTRLFQIIYKLMKMDTSFAMLISNQSYSDVNTEIDLR
tara:strand:- start:7274 stop:8143 length:870 start_codon:yes stop_codon:yes gene_type:complete